MTLEERVAALEARVAALEAPQPGFLTDCRIDYFRDGLQGGAVRITHLPTGVTVEGEAGAGDLRDLARKLAADLGGTLVKSGDITINDARAAEGLPPSPEPDEAFAARVGRVLPELLARELRKKHRLA